MTSSSSFISFDDLFLKQADVAALGGQAKTSTTMPQSNFFVAGQDLSTRYQTLDASGSWHITANLTNYQVQGIYVTDLYAARLFLQRFSGTMNALITNLATGTFTPSFACTVAGVCNTATVYVGDGIGNPVGSQALTALNGTQAVTITSGGASYTLGSGGAAASFVATVQMYLTYYTNLGLGGYLNTATWTPTTGAITAFGVNFVDASNNQLMFNFTANGSFSGATVTSASSGLTACNVALGACSGTPVTGSYTVASAGLTVDASYNFTLTTATAGNIAYSTVTPVFLDIATFSTAVTMNGTVPTFTFTVNGYWTTATITSTDASGCNVALGAYNGVATSTTQYTLPTGIAVNTTYHFTLTTGLGHTATSVVTAPAPNFVTSFGASVSMSSANVPTFSFTVLGTFTGGVIKDQNGVTYESGLTQTTGQGTQTYTYVASSALGTTTSYTFTLTLSNGATTTASTVTATVLLNTIAISGYSSTTTSGNYRIVYFTGTSGTITLACHKPFKFYTVMAGGGADAYYYDTYNNLSNSGGGGGVFMGYMTVNPADSVTQLAVTGGGAAGNSTFATSTGTAYGITCTAGSTTNNGYYSLSGTTSHMTVSSSYSNTTQYGPNTSVSGVIANYPGCGAGGYPSRKPDGNPVSGAGINFTSATFSDGTALSTTGITFSPLILGTGGSVPDSYFGGTISGGNGAQYGYGNDNPAAYGAGGDSNGTSLNYNTGRAGVVAIAFDTTLFSSVTV